MNVAQQLLAYPAVNALVQFGRERKYYVIAATCCSVALVYTIRRRRISPSSLSSLSSPSPSSLSQSLPPTSNSNSNPPPSSDTSSSSLITSETSVGNEGEKNVALENLIAEKREDSISSAIATDAEEARDKAKKKKAKIKQTVLDGVNLVMGESAGKFVESIIEISQTAKKGGVEGFVKTGKLGKIFSRDIIPWLKKKLQNKKFPTITGTTDSPIGDLHYEVSGITLESLDIDPSLEIDITDKSEAIQIKVLISSAMLKNISWKCGTAKFKEKGTANAEIVKAICFFRIRIEKSDLGLPKLSIKHCSIDLQQFNLDLKGGKASWVYNKLTTLFSNKIKTKLKEKIDKTLTKKCAQFENKINFAASKVLSLFSDKEKKKTATIVQNATPLPHKKCFLYSNETHTEEIECIMMDIKSFSDMAELRAAFFGEIGMPHLVGQTTNPQITNSSASTTSLIVNNNTSVNTRVRFRDRTGTLVSVSKSTTIDQLIQHAEYLCFYRDSLSSSTPGLSSSYSSSSNHYSLSASSPPALTSPRGNRLSHDSSSASFSSSSSSSSASLNINRSWNENTRRSHSANWNSYTNLSDDEYDGRNNGDY